MGVKKVLLKGKNVIKYQKSVPDSTGLLAFYFPF